GILVGNELRQEELRDHKNGQQEYEYKEKARHGIDEARPVIAAGSASAYASMGERHVRGSNLVGARRKALDDGREGLLIFGETARHILLLAKLLCQRGNLLRECGDGHIARSSGISA